MEIDSECFVRDLWNWGWTSGDVGVEDHRG